MMIKYYFVIAYGRPVCVIRECYSVIICGPPADVIIKYYMVISTDGLRCDWKLLLCDYHSVIVIVKYYSVTICCPLT